MEESMRYLRSSLAYTDGKEKVEFLSFSFHFSSLWTACPMLYYARSRATEDRATTNLRGCLKTK